MYFERQNAFKNILNYIFFQKKKKYIYICVPTQPIIFRPVTQNTLIFLFGLMVQEEIIRIHHECEGRIEKTVLSIAICHQEACRVRTNGDPEGWICLSYPHTNNEFYFLLTIVFFLFSNKLPEVSDYAEMQFHMMMSL